MLINRYTNPQTRTVRLLGSWDNFTQPYTMHRDRRLGPGHWKGCYTFSNGVCDGAALNPAAFGSGGLKMGGTYWYYVRFPCDLRDFIIHRQPADQSFFLDSISWTTTSNTTTKPNPPLLTALLSPANRSMCYRSLFYCRIVNPSTPTRASSGTPTPSTRPTTGP